MLGGCVFRSYLGSAHLYSSFFEDQDGTACSTIFAETCSGLSSIPRYHMSTCFVNSHAVHLELAVALHVFHFGLAMSCGEVPRTRRTFGSDLFAIAAQQLDEARKSAILLPREMLTQSRKCKHPKSHWQTRHLHANPSPNAKPGHIDTASSEDFFRKPHQSLL